ncbi:hypothetical protein BpHYR1_032384 [Brachionus plicatilis]|uniref:Uncharacterized protein n=1 Tax=Brachionus plicatilis TaxID=10195 RepID=A0A3M7SGS1_BRAPC|nr:hypothetical protein BpHYR1_032384 [Brachionus plicatilis]
MLLNFGFFVYFVFIGVRRGQLGLMIMSTIDSSVVLVACICSWLAFRLPLLDDLSDEDEDDLSNRDCCELLDVCACSSRFFFKPCCSMIS